VTSPAVLPAYVFADTKNKTGNVRVNVTLRRVHATIVAVEKHYIFWV
jgi:hypothetical protein